MPSAVSAFAIWNGVCPARKSPKILLYPEPFRKGFIRFSVGLEDVEDIIADLDQGLKAVGL